MLSYAFQVAMSLIQNRGFRNTVLRCLVSLYRNLGTPDYVNMCQCLIFLDDPLAVAELLDRLSKGSQDCVLMAYQIAFDLYESATQQFLGRVLQALRATAPIPGALMVKPVVKPTVAAATTAAATTKPAEASTESASVETENNVVPTEDKTQRSVESLVGIVDTKKERKRNKLISNRICELSY